MVCLRIVAASAALLIGIGAAAAETGAEGAPGGVPGRPISLAPTTQPATVTTKKLVHVKSAAKLDKKTEKKAHRKFAAVKPVHVAMQSAAATPAAWPALSPMPTADAASMAPPASAFPANPPSDSQLREMVIDGQTVRISSPNDVNELDLAGDKAGGAPAATKSDTPAPASASVATVAADDATPMSDSSWYMQVFAALGGAVAAGSIAWFLIGSAPHRMYG
jgi:hypothetical protein